MRNIFLFIRRYIHLLTFLLLQGICIYLISRYSKFHNAAILTAANRVTGSVFKEFDRVEYYFRLKKTNDSLVKANEDLLNRLKQNFILPDTSEVTRIDSIKVDSLQKFRSITYLSAKVVSSSIAAQNNFLVINGPNVKKMSIGMGVADINFAVTGIITDISGDYAVVMSLLHKDSRISASLKKSGEAGTLLWDGKQPNIITLKNIPKGTPVSKGDTVISSGLSTTFPRGLLVGRINEIFEETGTSNLNIKVKTAANFYNLEYVYVIDNIQTTPVNQLLEKAKKHL
ncbi:MAG TPA: rod shape-determining protein MreC [Ferruginibacter sp.]|nr:rod shape-determining protein MreC [Bacteroidota bacterium]MCC6693364.1 rod shape-determining protein MreC [Chitinophagaceae bacterium]HMT95692.1 rod shape-determining protein MreC [Ferruginibacter sp.]MBS1926356.1 rod shape-determining protein MreC [Bacteroidota bacterium]HMU24838.1 rod shape-determining protein MreC [Ferruginibacter sp.]